MKKIVIASDSFKGSLSSADVAKAAAAGILDIFPDCEVTCLAMGDGGEGTCEAIADTFECSWNEIHTTDPLGRPITAKYAVSMKHDSLAIIELAQASGLTLLNEKERNPLMTSTFGTGLMIMDAAEKGYRNFIIGLGGSATNDAGTGMLEALGFRFLDENGRQITGSRGEKLIQIASIDDSGVAEAVRACSFTVACDVETPFYGTNGATRIFAPQKGADSESVETREKGMASFAEVIHKRYGIDLGSIEGAGAAGGTGGAIHAFLNGKLCKGSELILDAAGFDSIIEGADLIITGEGRIDNQTFYGKLPSAILKRASKKNIPVIAIGGLVDLSEEDIINSGFTSILPIQDRPADAVSLAKAMEPATTTQNIRVKVAEAISR